MGFKIFGKKDGKRTVSDNPESGDAKVTEAAKVLPEVDPGTVSKGTIIRFLWDPKTGIPFVGFKVKSVKHPFPQKRLRKRKLYPIR